jgi:uncharacterized protein (TIGR03000 family)
MVQRIVALIGIAVLVFGIGGGRATAQHVHHSGGHAGSGHVAVAPHATYVRPNNHFYGGHGYYGGHAYRGYGYRYPNYGYHHGYYGYRYPYYRNGFAFGLSLYPYYFGNYAYGYPNYYGYSYPDYGSSYVPNFAAPQGIAPSTNISAYPPAEPAPPPADVSTAHITVQLPANARLWIDDQPTQQTGSVRTFETPPNLDPARTYSYKLRAEWVENGQPMVRERDVSFKPGSQVVVNMTIQ